MLSLMRLHAQECTALNFTYATSESRCMATGSVTVAVTGGSGNYNYKVTGPVSTTFTSSNNITGLEPGTYELTVKDVNTGCEKKENITISGSYADLPISLRVNMPFSFAIPAVAYKCGASLFSRIAGRLIM